MLEERRRHDGADRVATEILGTGRAKAVTEETRDRVVAARLEFAAEHVEIGEHDARVPLRLLRWTVLGLGLRRYDSAARRHALDLGVLLRLADLAAALFLAAHNGLPWFVAVGGPPGLGAPRLGRPTLSTLLRVGSPMPRVVVTGGSGKLGQACVADLVEHGWDVVNVDRVPPPRPVSPFLRVDLTDFGQVVEALSVNDGYRGVDAVVHLAAIPAPGLTANAATFANNITTTYNVFAAARHAGITNVVWASSETVLGLPFDIPPPYIPVDEEYPARPESTYSLVKHLEEQMAIELVRWDAELKMIGLRFSNVMDPADYVAFPGYDADPSLRKWNLWGYIDARDGAQAIRKALAYEPKGCDVFIIAAADTVMSRSNNELTAEIFPDVGVRATVGEHTTLLAIDKARRVLGFEPQFSWRG